MMFMFEASGIGLAFGVAFTALLASAAEWDVRRRRIPNALVLATFLLGAGFAVVTSGVSGAAWRVMGGAGTALLVWMPFWLLGVMGAGDVKFFAAGAAWLGPRHALGAAVVAAILGGVLAVAWVMAGARGREGAGASVASARAPNALDSEGPDGGVQGRRQLSLPYGVAMAAGLAITAWFPQMIH